MCSPTFYILFDPIFNPKRPNKLILNKSAHIGASPPPRWHLSWSGALYPLLIQPSKVTLRVFLVTRVFATLLGILQ